MQRRALSALVTLAVIAGGCSSSGGSAAEKPRSPATSESRCADARRFGAGGTPNEIHATSTGGEVWGLALGPGPVPPLVGETLKIVWRVTGSGPLEIRFTDPSGRRHPLTFGPEAHSSSSYHRPGDEWGSGFRFTRAGCWHIRLQRVRTTGDVWLEVA
jgi:hypothetical protein